MLFTHLLPSTPPNHNQLTHISHSYFHKMEKKNEKDGPAIKDEQWKQERIVSQLARCHLSQARAPSWCHWWGGGMGKVNDLWKVHPAWLRHRQHEDRPCVHAPPPGFPPHLRLKAAARRFHADVTGPRPDVTGPRPEPFKFILIIIMFVGVLHTGRVPLQPQALMFGRISSLHFLQYWCK